MKATPNIVASNNKDVCPTLVSNADDITVMSSIQNEELRIIYSTPTTKDPPEGKTSAVIAVVRGKPKYGYHPCRSNKHYKQTLVQVLRDSGSNRYLCEQRQTHDDSLLKKAGSKVVEYFEWDLPD